MMNFRIVQFALALNGIGALLLALAFQATSTDVMLVTDKAKSTAAFCIGNRAMFVVEGHGVGFGTTCPESNTMKPTAVVNSDHPILFPLGFWLTVFGTAGQIFFMDKPPLSRQVRRQEERHHL